MEEEDDNSAHKRKPWGETLHFCPVALKDNGVLWPGSQDTALRLVITTIIMLEYFNYHCATIYTSYIRYCDRLYYFSSEEAKETFAVNPLHYVDSIKVNVLYFILPYY